MITPADPALLDTNPNFTKLRARLVKDILDGDASTCAANVSNAGTCQDLQHHRLEHVRNQILTASLFNIVDSDLPTELRECILVAASYVLDGPSPGVTRADAELLLEDTSKLYDGLPEISRLLNQDIKHQHNALRDIAATSQGAIFASNVPSLGATAGTRTHRKDEASSLHQLVDAQTSRLKHIHEHDIPTSLHETIDTLVALLHTQATHLQHLVRHMEQRKHGADARHLASKAQFLVTVAQGLQAKTKVSYLEQRRDLYSPELVKKLEITMQELDEEDDRLESRKIDLHAALGEYDEAGGTVMAQLGRRYGEIQKEIEEVKADVERLERENG